MGTTDKSSIYRLLNCGEARHNADWNWHDVSSPFARLHIVHEGSGYIYIGKERHLLREGHIYLTPPFALHSNECHGFLHLSYIHLYESSHTLKRILEEHETPIEIKANEMVYAIFKELIALNPNSQLAVYDPKKYVDDSTVKIRRGAENVANNNLAMNNLLLNTLLLPFIEQGHPKEEVNDKRVTKMVDYIRHNIYSPISIEQLCEIVHLSPNHTIRLFNQYMGETPIEYILHRKIETACLLLTTRSMSVKDIAYKLSFNNISYFNLVFKRYMNTTPKLYRSL